MREWEESGKEGKEEEKKKEEDIWSKGNSTAEETALEGRLHAQQYNQTFSQQIIQPNKITQNHPQYRL